MSEIRDKRLNALPFPLKNAGNFRSADPTDMLNLDLIGKGRSANNSSVIQPSADYTLAKIGEIKIVATRTTPCTSVAEDEQKITLAMLYAGEKYRYQKESSIQHIEPGSIHLCQRTGGE